MATRLFAQPTPHDSGPHFAVTNHRIALPSVQNHDQTHLRITFTSGCLALPSLHSSGLRLAFALLVSTSTKRTFPKRYSSMAYLSKSFTLTHPTKPQHLNAMPSLCETSKLNPSMTSHSILYRHAAVLNHALPSPYFDSPHRAFTELGLATRNQH